MSKTDPSLIRNVTLQFPLTVTDQSPFSSPFNACRRYPGRSRSEGVQAASSTARTFSSRSFQFPLTSRPPGLRLFCSTRSAAGRNETCNWKSAIRPAYLELRESGFVQSKLAASSMLPLPFHFAICGKAQSGRVRATPLAGFDPLLYLVAIICSGATPSSTQRSRALPMLCCGSPWAAPAPKLSVPDRLRSVAYRVP